MAVVLASEGVCYLLMKSGTIVPAVLSIESVSVPAIRKERYIHHPVYISQII